MFVHIKWLLFLISIHICIVVTTGKKSILKITLDRINLDCKTEYITNCTSQIRKVNRTSTYSLKANAYLKYALDSNLTMVFKTFEWKNNQFKESFIYFEKNLCDYLSRDKWLKPIVQKFSRTPDQCPVTKGYFPVDDLTVDVKYFPKFFPSGKWRFQFNVLRIPDRLRVIRVECDLIVENLIVKNK